VQMAYRLTSVFGLPYQVLQIEVPISLIDLLMGDVVRVIWTKLPDDEGNVQGPVAVDRVGWVTARRFALRKARGELTLYLPGRAYGGYAPEARVASIEGSGSDKRVITIESDYMPPGGTTADFWRVGDRVQFWQWNSTVAIVQLGIVITPAPSGNTLTIQPVDADDNAQSWDHTFGSPTWVIGPRQANDIGESLDRQPIESQENQRRFAVVAGPDGRITWNENATGPNPEPARVFAS